VDNQHGHFSLPQSCEWFRKLPGIVERNSRTQNDCEGESLKSLQPASKQFFDHDTVTFVVTFVVAQFLPTLRPSVLDFLWMKIMSHLEAKEVPEQRLTASTELRHGGLRMAADSLTLPATVLGLASSEILVTFLGATQKSHS